MIIKYIGLTADVSALIEKFRQAPTEPEYEIIQRMAGLAVRPPSDNSAPESAGSDQRGKGCHLGSGVYLLDGERMFCFRYKSSLQAIKPEGIAIAKNGALYIDDHKIEPSKGSLVQPALQFIQKKMGDVSPTNGGLISLDAWEFWYVLRGGQFVTVGKLRTPDRIARRNRRQEIAVQLADLGL